MYFGSNVRFITKIHVTIVSYIFKREILSLFNFVFFKKSSWLWSHFTYEDVPHFINRRQYEYYTEDIRPKSKD